MTTQLVMCPTSTRFIRRTIPFQIVTSNPSESEYNGPYNKLLYTLFPADSDFVVVPLNLLHPRNPADFISTFEVLLLKIPVLVLQLKPPSHLNVPSKHQAADEQIRSHMGDLVEFCPLRTLYAVSALETKLCFYNLDPRDENAEIVPLAIPRHATRLNDTAPATRWGYDILEPSREERFRKIVEEIKAGRTVVV
ncbi:unnamed protein product [Cyclocybe aegerita]|uniref:Uncharacterized protein n=1 Tax=Cyclocybe aegerita TaxID=1973307 RepID=A0A8S0VTS8_CYCAE|nr:unnamed protein product [Cyclocybe aegerita]